MKKHVQRFAFIPNSKSFAPISPQALANLG